MPVKYFVDESSIVRKIWGKADTVLFIFAGAAAEFALNKAVDWLYFTGKLPADPLGRLFATVTYSRKILFSTENNAYAAIDQITAIHQYVEAARGAQIPDWAYRDVLFMLIDYTIRAYELLERKLTPEEKSEVFDVFYNVGNRMGLKGLPGNYNAWLIMRTEHLQQNMAFGSLTADLFKQYRKHLGGPRYWLLLKVQGLVTPPTVRKMLRLPDAQGLMPVLAAYKLTSKIGLQHLLRDMLLPAKYKAQIRELDRPL
ncbi:oxygenase MpaB family protein [Mucilaginibacter glaciei]|uniref:DUF2236 domain-containing protein n=1 Tax=Mucilaginibacter glaciei TaxID=2772109 RepID=A0A926NSW2_9SPHI|nr:oxygenase MpaB family protein [Mucilaginibacter glaciei]MBD1393360.1 DUF2236 domain-containing protein [Mucilaginibacter glaciei]